MVMTLSVPHQAATSHPGQGWPHSVSRLEVELEASRLDLAGLHGEIITFKLQQPGILLPVNDWRDSAVMEGTLNTGTVWIPSSPNLTI